MNNKVPQQYIDFSTSDTFSNLIEEIGTSEELNVDQEGELYAVVAEVLRGLSDSARLLEAISKRLEVEPLKARAIMQEVNKKIFTALRDSLENPAPQISVIQPARQQQAIPATAQSPSFILVTPPLERQDTVEKVQVAGKMEIVGGNMSGSVSTNAPTAVPSTVSRDSVKVGIRSVGGIEIRDDYPQPFMPKTKEDLAQAPKPVTQAPSPAPIATPPKNAPLKSIPIPTPSGPAVNRLKPATPTPAAATVVVPMKPKTEVSDLQSAINKVIGSNAMPVTMPAPDKIVATPLQTKSEPVAAPTPIPTPEPATELAPAPIAEQKPQPAPQPQVTKIPPLAQVPQYTSDPYRETI